ncbi:MAG: tetratricopeptide repeat protein, partial [Armatimonadetes bacterium]|nr:tetratricopeptide repeat protein [Anaerolineae bacterium]
QSAAPSFDQFAQADDAPAAAADNSLEWLESLARRQGVDAEELTTSASFTLPPADAVPAARTPGYTDYSFDTPTTEAAADPLSFLESMSDDDAEFGLDDTEEMSDWLAQLAGDQPAAAAPDTAQIMDKLARNDVNPNEIENWMANLLEQGAARSDVQDYVDDDSEAIIQADLPSWLTDQIGTPPPAAAVKPLSNPSVEPSAPAMPAWLTEDINAENEQLDFDAIFDTATQTPAALPAARISTDEVEIDTSDPWVEAFELERKQGMDDISQVPAWYSARLEHGDDLTAAALPAENELPAGTLQMMPDWLTGAAPAPAAAAVATAASDVPDWLRDDAFDSADELDDAPAIMGDLPDWLRTAGVNLESVPDWLKDTIKTDETPIVMVETLPEPAPKPVSVVAPVSPAIVPAAVAAIDVTQALTAARAGVRANNLDDALLHYESVVRANTALDAVVGDLGTLMKDEVHKKNPALYRVLGDGLMRQGKLQDALETYRKALNLL